MLRTKSGRDSQRQQGQKRGRPQPVYGLVAWKQRKEAMITVLDL